MSKSWTFLATRCHNLSKIKSYFSQQKQNFQLGAWFTRICTFYQCKKYYFFLSGNKIIEFLYIRRFQSKFATEMS